MNDETQQPLSLRDSIGHFEFSTLQVYELRARRKDGGFSDLESPSEPPEGGTVDAPLEVQFFIQQEPERMAVRAVLTVETPDAEITVDVAALYTRKFDFHWGPQEWAQFIDRIAMGNLFPFIRQHAFDLAQRLGVHLMIGIIQLGQGVVTVNDDGSEGVGEIP